MASQLLLVEQNASLALAMSDYAYVLENGKIVLDGPSAELQQDKDIKNFTSVPAQPKRISVK